VGHGTAYGRESTAPFSRLVDVMEPTRTEKASGGEALTAYDFAMEDIRVASSKLARALLARTLARTRTVALSRVDSTSLDRERSDARLVYEKMIDLYLRLRLDDTQRASFLKELGVLRARLEEREAQGRPQPTRRQFIRSQPVRSSA
jgi:hypothetical protein